MNNKRRKRYLKARNIKKNNLPKSSYRGIRLSQAQADKIIKLADK